jgi:Tfp pilus assembly protein PilV
MEVNIALLIMAVGLVGILTLFPVGLRQGDSASSDTTESAFADLVLNAMRSNAQMVTNWTDWSSNSVPILLGQSKGTASPNVMPINVPGTSSTSIVGTGTPTEIQNYLVSGQYLQYSLNVTNNDLIITAWIQVTNRRYTDITRAPIYATSFVFMGM